MDVGCAGGGQKLGSLLGEGGEVEAGAAQEILGLSDIHPETLEVKRVQLAVAAHGGEGLLLDGCRTQLDAAKHGRVEDVDAGIYPVSDELDGLLDEAVDPRVVVRLVHDDAVFRWLLDLGDHNGTLVAVGFVEGSELGERIIADNVRVEDEEGLGIFAENLFGKLERTGGA